MMNFMHEERKLLSAFMDGELSGEEYRRVQTHLDSCAACSAELASLSSVKRVMSEAPRFSAPGDLVSALQRRYRPADGTSWLGRLNDRLAVPRFWVPVGALALAALAVAFWFGPKEEEIPLEPLLAAHSRYKAESWAPHGDLLAANFSAEVAQEYEK